MQQLSYDEAYQGVQTMPLVVRSKKEKLRESRKQPRKIREDQGWRFTAVLGATCMCCSYIGIPVTQTLAILYGFLVDCQDAHK